MVLYAKQDSDVDDVFGYLISCFIILALKTNLFTKVASTLFSLYINLS